MQESISTVQDSYKKLDTAAQALVKVGDILADKKRQDSKGSITAPKRVYGVWYELSYSGFGFHWREGQEFEKFLRLFQTWQTAVKDARSDIKVLLDEISEIWQINGLEYIEGGFLRAPCLRFRPSFFIQTLENNREHPDYELPGLIRQAANDYELTTNLIGRPVWILKRACFQFIALIANRIYYHGFEKLSLRQEALKKLQDFIKALIRSAQEFPELNKGSNFRSQLDLCINKIESALEKIVLVLKKKPAIEKWLENYYKNAKLLLTFLPRYIHYSIQTSPIPHDLDSHLQEVFRNFQAIVEGELVVTINAARSKTIMKILNRGKIRLAPEGQLVEYSSEELCGMITRKEIDMVAAGFYLDYVAANPVIFEKFKRSCNSGEEFVLSGEQFLRELIYDSSKEYIKNQKLINNSLQLYRSSKEESREYALIFLRQHVLQVDRVLDLAVYHQREQNSKLAKYLLNLAQNIFNPVMLRIFADTENTFETWRPGIFHDVSLMRKSTVFSRDCRNYYQQIMDLINISYRLAYYCWIVRELEWATVGDGNNIIAASNAEVLDIISKTTLTHIIGTITGIVSNFLKIKEQISREIDKDPSPPVSRWLYYQSNLPHNLAYQGLLKALEELSFYCQKETIGSYTSGIAIESQLRSARDSAQLLQDIYAMLPGVSAEEIQSMEEGRVLREHIWESIRRFQHKKELKKMGYSSPSTTSLKDLSRSLPTLYETKERKKDGDFPVFFSLYREVAEEISPGLLSDPHASIATESRSRKDSYRPAGIVTRQLFSKSAPDYFDEETILQEISLLLVEEADKDFSCCFIHCKNLIKNLITDQSRLLALTHILTYAAKKTKNCSLDNGFVHHLVGLLQFIHLEFSAFYGAHFQRFQRFKMILEKSIKTLRCCLQQQDPMIFAAFIINLQNLSLEIAAIKNLRISDKATKEEYSHIHKLCDKFLVAVKPEFRSAAYATTVSAVDDLRVRIVSGEVISATELPKLYKMFELELEFSYKIIAKLCILQQLSSMFPLLLERAWIIEEFIADIMKKIDGIWAGRKQEAMMPIVYRRLYNIFFIAIPDCLLNSQNRCFIKKLMGALLMEFGISTVFLPETNKFIVKEPMVTAKIPVEAMESLLKKLEDLANLDSWIFNMAQSKDREEMAVSYERIKLELALLMPHESSEYSQSIYS